MEKGNGKEKRKRKGTTQAKETSMERGMKVEGKTEDKKRKWEIKLQERSGRGNEGAYLCGKKRGGKRMAKERGRKLKRKGKEKGKEHEMKGEGKGKGKGKGL